MFAKKVRMLTNLRSRFSKPERYDPEPVSKPHKPNRNEYSRPVFLKLTDDEYRASENHDIRPIILPKSDTALPWNAGYAECVSTRVKQNEDQTAMGEIKLDHRLTPDQQAQCSTQDGTQYMEASVRGMYFGVFDGHGGPGAALMVADQLINHLQEKLVDVQKDLFELALRECKETKQTAAGSEGSAGSAPTTADTPTEPCKLFNCVTFDDLIVGALEAAFHAMDEHIGGEKASFNISGGCCTLVALFLFGKLYVANAGDCRAVAYLADQVIPLSTDFSADQDADRIYDLAHHHPELTNGHFSTSQFCRYVHRSDLGQRLLCRTPYSGGWSRKEVTSADINFPLIHGTQKGSRLMNCIGVSRSLGDYDLTDMYTGLRVKPFLSCTPEVKVLDLRQQTLSDQDVLVMGSDGLWDMIPNHSMGRLVHSALQVHTQGSHKYKHAAHQAVLQARGEKDLDPDQPGWRTEGGHEPSHDDITALVVPLHLTATFTCLTLSPH